MQYLIAGVCIILCIIVIVFGLGVLKESRKMGPKQTKNDDDDTEYFHNLRS